MTGDRYDNPIVAVTWTDSSLQNGQVHVSDTPEPEIIVSVGWLVKENAVRIVLARDDHKDDEWRGLCAIPRRAISHVERIADGHVEPSRLDGDGNPLNRQWQCRCKQVAYFGTPESFQNAWGHCPNCGDGYGKRPPWVSRVESDD